MDALRSTHSEIQIQTRGIHPDTTGLISVGSCLSLWYNRIIHPPDFVSLSVRFTDVIWDEFYGLKFASFMWFSHRFFQAITCSSMAALLAAGDNCSSECLTRGALFMGETLSDITPSRLELSDSLSLFNFHKNSKSCLKLPRPHRRMFPLHRWRNRNLSWRRSLAEQCFIY